MLRAPASASASASAGSEAAASAEAGPRGSGACSRRRRSGSHILHPRLVTLKSDDHRMLDDGVNPWGRRRLPLNCRPLITR
eukprot:5700595-Pyramimonas_sp.AAC.1